MIQLISNIKFSLKNQEKISNIYVAILVVMNFIHCFDNSLWGDEAFTAVMARSPLSDMLSQTAADVHPPLYYVFTRIAYLLAGDSGTAYRFVSFIAYFLIIIVALTFVRKKFGTITALTLITFSSIASCAIRHNVEIRMYSWACLFVLLSYLSVYMILNENSWKSWMSFTLFSLCAAYTHYYALVMVAVFYAGFILLAVWNKKYRLKIAAASMITIVSYLPWFIVLLKTFKRTSSDWWLQDIPSLKESVIILFDHKWVVLVLAIGFVVFVLNESKIKINKQFDFTNDLIFVIFGIVSMVGTIAVGLGMSYAVRPFWVTRYLWPVSAVIYIVLGMVISKIKHRHLCCILVLIFFIYQAIPSYLEILKRDISLAEETTAFVEKINLDSSDLVLTNSFEHAHPILEYYYPDTESVYIDNANFDVPTEEKEVWIFWSEELSEEIVDSFADYETVCEYVYDGKLGSNGRLFVYKFVENKAF